MQSIHLRKCVGRELGKLGIKVSETTVAKYVVRHGRLTKKR